MDDKSKTGKQDDLRINVHEEYELRYWIEKFGVSRDELIAAVEAVGPMAKDVEAYLSN
ncbi:MAG: DUF3606 domain-containing protein [Bacteroidia bacterium]